MGNRQPIPVCLKRKDLKGELERAVSSTYMNQNRGTCTYVRPASTFQYSYLFQDRSVKFATLSQTPKQILENLKVALPAIMKHIANGWDNIQALHIKTNSSVSLPIWSCTLDEAGGRSSAAEEEWTGFGTEVGQGDSSESGTDDISMTKTEPKVRGKGKKRAQGEEQGEHPKKKAKGVKGQPEPVESPTKSDLPRVVETKSTSKGSKKSGIPVETQTLDAANPAKGTLRKKTSQSLSTTATGSVRQKNKKTTAEVSAVSSVTNEELKQKRSGAPGEKKKSKINAAGAKSAKDRILGKKVVE